MGGIYIRTVVLSLPTTLKQVNNRIRKTEYYASAVEPFQDHPGRQENASEN